MTGAPLRCPSCGSLHERASGFCPACGMPLVIDSDAGEEAASGPRHEHARKINPSYAQGQLVRVAFANHQAEAELIQGLLLEEGIPSLLKRSAGFDVPDMLAAGPRSVYVPEGGAEQAKALLADVDATAGPDGFADDDDDDTDDDALNRATRTGGVGVPPRVIAAILIIVLVVITLFSALVR